MKSKTILIILIALTLTIPFWNTLSTPWSTIDDWHTIKNFHFIENQWDQSFSQGLSATFRELTVGRHRNVYWASQYYLIKIFSLSPVSQHLVHIGILFITNILIINIAYLLFSSLVTGFLATTIFSLSGITASNWVRLGPAEPLLLLFQLTSFYFLLKLLKKKDNSIFLNLLIILFTLLTLFTKETAVLGIVFPLTLLFVYPKRKNKIIPTIVTYVVVFVSFIIPKILTSSINSGYSSNFTFTLNSWFKTILSYTHILSREYIYFIPSIIMFIMILINHNKTRPITLPVFFWAITFILFQSFWSVSLGRYLLPFMVPFSLLLSYTTITVFNLYSHVIIRFILVVMLILSFTQNIIDLNITSNNWLNQDKGNYQALSYLALTSLPNTILYANIPTDPAFVEWWIGKKLLASACFRETRLNSNPSSGRHKTFRNYISK